MIITTNKLGKPDVSNRSRQDGIVESFFGDRYALTEEMNEQFAVVQICKWIHYRVVTVSRGRAKPKDFFALNIVSHNHLLHMVMAFSMSALNDDTIALDRVHRA